MLFTWYAMTVKDKIYPPEVAEAISRARSERWALLSHLAAYPYDHKSWLRKRQLDKELYKLTGHAIYRTTRG